MIMHMQLLKDSSLVIGSRAAARVYPSAACVRRSRRAPTAVATCSSGNAWLFAGHCTGMFCSLTSMPTLRLSNKGTATAGTVGVSKTKAGLGTARLPVNCSHYCHLGMLRLPARFATFNVDALPGMQIVCPCTTIRSPSQKLLS